MPLTPEDVHKKTFTPVRLREGYDMGEVDQFLDEVETELIRLQQENEELRTKLATVSTAAPSAPTSAVATPAADKPAHGQPAVEVPPLPVVKTVPEASSAAARLLEIATNNADQLVAEAKNDADKIIGEARTKAERLEAESKVKADRLESDARTRAQMLDSETAERRQQMFGELERERDKLNSEVETLRAFEREYRSRLKSYFSQQLEALSGPGEAPAVSDDQPPAPKRLRSILGDDEV